MSLRLRRVFCSVAHQHPLSSLGREGQIPEASRVARCAAVKARGVNIWRTGRSEPQNPEAFSPQPGRGKCLAADFTS